MKRRWLAGIVGCAVALAALAGCTADEEGFIGRPRRSAAVPAATPIEEPPSSAIAAPQERTSEVTFVPASKDFPNPERGFYQQHDLLGATDVGLAASYESGLRLVLGMVRLDAHRTGALSPATLESLSRAFALIRHHGLKVILRFAYNSPVDYSFVTAPDASLPLVRQHLAELKPLLHDNADVVAFWQAGFIGAWGEWHSSANRLETPEGKLGVRDALLDALPPGRTLQVRYAADVMAWYPTPPSEAVMPGSSGAAFFGLHNDCFLASASDVSTYDPSPAIAAGQRAYVRALSAITPFGGETCNPIGLEAGHSRSRCTDILNEGRDYHLTYLNRDYYAPAFHDRWQAEGCYSTVAATMGYRFQLVAAAHDAVVDRGAKVRLKLSVRNTGWARMTNPRPLHILLRHRRTGRTIDYVADAIEPRGWLPGEITHLAEAEIQVPVDVEPGDHDLLLALPDASVRLANDPRYAVRWANADDAVKGQVWEPARGRYRLGTTLEVK